jgi:hypothetical protein
LRSLIFGLLAATWFASLVAPASGAEIRPTRPEELRFTGFADVILEGKLETGDYDKLLKLIDEDCRDYSCTSGIYLASPGGDLIEAMKIGRLVRKLRLETHVPIDPTPPRDLLPEFGQKSEAILKDLKAILKDAKANYMCASACFFMFVAGIDRERDIFRPVLGIHRPYLSEADLKRLSGNQVIASAGQMRTVVEDYLKEMGVPAKYADLMFSIPKDQVRPIDENDFESDFEGYIPELRDWLEAKCNNLTDVEKVVSKGIEAKKRRREKLTEDDERMNRMLTKKTFSRASAMPKRCQSYAKRRGNSFTVNEIFVKVSAQRTRQSDLKSPAG